LKWLVTLTTVLRYRAACDELCASKKVHKVPHNIASAQTDMFAADDSSGAHCRVIKIYTTSNGAIAPE